MSEQIGIFDEAAKVRLEAGFYTDMLRTAGELLDALDKERLYAIERAVAFEKTDSEGLFGFTVRPYLHGFEIVRCGDCEWFKEGVVAGKLGKLPNQCLRPTYSGERLELTPEPDDFCSWGARREE